ncbi:TPA: transposase [Staphylococcus aureus]|uniref:transposase n=1 Tax=Staphylococcus aureus TaxID=1280 RepID=UPI001303A00B|nr:transposase [Staphylococcus aureus]HAR2858363.1 transposase [Staphylococcus aureus]HAR2942576.1 transposase [Staphylococcus aureus]
MIEPVIDIDATMGKEFRYLSHIEKTSRFDEVYYLYTIICVDMGEQVKIRLSEEKEFTPLEKVGFENITIKPRVYQDMNTGYCNLYTSFSADDIYSLDNKE